MRSENPTSKADKLVPTGWYQDTDPKALEVFVQLHRDMTPGERAARVFELSAFQEN